MENQSIEQKYIASLENTLQLLQQNAELQNQIAALQKENETLLGEKRERITKEARDTFEIVKDLSDGYVMTYTFE